MNAFSCPNSNQWRKLYEQIRNESNPATVIALLEQLEGVMFDRYGEIASGHADQEESAEMAAASKELLRIKTNTLGWPGIPNLELEMD